MIVCWIDSMDLHFGEETVCLISLAGEALLFFVASIFVTILLWGSLLYGIYK